MELIFKRQATVANTPIVMKFDVFANGVTRSTPKTVGITDKSVA